MHVGVFSRDLDPTQGGGFTFEQEILRNLADLAGSSRHQFTIVSGADAARQGNVLGLPAAHVERGGIARVVTLAQWSAPSLARLWNRMSPLAQTIRDRKIDLMWFAGSSFAPVDIPYLCVVWDLQFRRQPWWPEVSQNGEWARRERYFGAMLRRATGVITGLEVGKSEIIRYFGIESERVHLLRHPTPRFALEGAGAAPAPQMLRDLGLEPGYIFYPAQFWPHKNHVGLLGALQILGREHGWRPQLVLVGSDKGAQDHVRETAARMGLAEQVRILGFVSTEALVELYRHALVLAYVTYFGPENLPPLEAFALGCPVVATAVAGAREQLGDAALLVPPGDDHALAAALHSVSVDSSLRERLTARGAQRAAEWTGRDYVEGVLSILDEFEKCRRCW